MILLIAPTSVEKANPKLFKQTILPLRDLTPWLVPDSSRIGAPRCAVRAYAGLVTISLYPC